MSQKPTRITRIPQSAPVYPATSQPDERTAFPAHLRVGEPGDERPVQLPCVASNEHDWQWQYNPQSTPRTYRMCPHCHAIDITEGSTE